MLGPHCPWLPRKIDNRGRQGYLAEIACLQDRHRLLEFLYSLLNSTIIYLLQFNQIFFYKSL